MNEQAAPAPSQSYVHAIRMGANMILKGHQTANLSLRLTTNTMLSAHTHTHTHTYLEELTHMQLGYQQLDYAERLVDATYI